MTDDNNDLDDLDDLGKRIRAARAAENSAGSKNGPNGGPDNNPNEGVGQAIRIGTDLLSGLIVGAGIGWFIDGWLETRPWFMILFFFLGAGAGILNVYRSAGLIERGSLKKTDSSNNPTDSNDLPQ